MGKECDSIKRDRKRRRDEAAKIGARTLFEVGVKRRNIDTTSEETEQQSTPSLQPTEPLQSIEETPEEMPTEPEEMPTASEDMPNG